MTRRRAVLVGRVSVGGFMVLTPLLVFAALAWACNPQAHIALDKTTYEAGSAITVKGSYFPANSTITVTGPVDSKTVTASQGGGFVTQLTAPASAGNYTVTASRPTGGFAAASFTVTEPPPGSDPPAGQPAPAEPSPPPGSAPDLLGPLIYRPARPRETVSVTRSGSFTLFCGRFQEPGVTGTCGTASKRTTPWGKRPFVVLRAKSFRAEVGGAVRRRFVLTPTTLRRVKAARRMRMRGTVIARDLLGNQTTQTFSFILKAPRPARAGRR